MGLLLVLLFSFLCAFCKASPTRLLINGSTILSPEGAPITLKGFNWYLPLVDDDDGDLMSGLLPGTNLVRLVGVFWDNFVGAESQTDCRTDDASTGFIKDSCVQDLEKAVRTATAAGLWVIITGSAKYAAGQDNLHSNVFHNDTLKSQYFAMWAYLAAHFSRFDNIAAYEIMSEPRVQTTPDSVVAGFMAGGCKAVHSVDPVTPCMVGPAPFYKAWKLSSTYIMTDQPNTIYTYDFLEPDPFVHESFHGTMEWGGSYACNVVYKGWTEIFCPKNASQLVTIDREWLTILIKDFVVALRDRFNVPVLANQFGIKRAVGDGNGRWRYLSDVLSVFHETGMHAAYWLWKWEGKADGSDHWGGFELIHKWANGTVDQDMETLKLFNSSWKR